MLPSRVDLEGWPRGLRLLAAVADVRGDRAVADALLAAAQRIDALDLTGRRQFARSLRQDPAAAGLSPVVVQLACQLLSDGVAPVTSRECSRLPADLAALLGLEQVDPAEIIRAHRRHGVVTGSDLAAAIAAQGDDETRPLAAWLPELAARRPRMPLGRALGLVETVARQLDDPALFGTLHPVGSVRRSEPTIGDVDVLLVHPAPAVALTRALERLEVTDIPHRGQRRAVVTLGRDQVNFRAVTPPTAPTVLVWHTGSAAHVAALRREATGRGLELRPQALLDADGQRVPCRTEAEVYQRLGLAFVPPELRHGEDEIDRARRGELPRLVTVEDIRGDLHTHTLWSDGRDSVAGMVHAARALGYAYVAITDHSPSAAATRVLTRERLARQAEEIEQVRARVSDITVLHGVEVDILPDGSLDLPDEDLARLDIVLASLHEPHGHGPARLLARYASAMRHPLVHVVTHPANRLVGTHEGYGLDYDALFALAVETGTALEIDGGPAHLDLDGHLARRAVAAGVVLTIDSDCHHALRLGRQMRMGVGTARRGAVEARHVLNTRPLAEVLAFFRAKRQRLAAAR